MRAEIEMRNDGMDERLAAEALKRIEEALALAVEALKPFESGSIEARVKAGNELVTEADCAVNKVLHQTLQREGEGWLSEESADDRSRLESDNVWIVDPIDGTKEFVAGIPEWCVSIAFVRRGVAIAGGIVNPATGESFLGAAGSGLTYVGDGAPAEARGSLSGATVLASRSEVKRGEWEAFCNSAFSIVPTGSVAYKLARVAAGLADATWTLTPKHEWDVAAGVALVESAGGFVRTLDFARPVLNQPNALMRGLMASTAKLGEEMAALLQEHVEAQNATRDEDLEPVGTGDSGSAPAGRISE